MGRSGGFGGRGLGGGFSSGGRSSGGFGGGFSGGGRSSRSFGGRSRSGGGSSSFGGSSYDNNTGGFLDGMILGQLLSGRNSQGGNGGNYIPPNNPQTPQYLQQNPNSKGTNSSGSGCRTIFIILGIILMLVVLFNVVSCAMGSSTSDMGITKSTIERTVLPAGSVNETEYYTDADLDWIDRPHELEEGMHEFYRLTGVQPYVYILPNGTTNSIHELSTMAEKLYDQLFTDEAHFLLVFCDYGDGSFNCGYEMGSQAKTLMDDEAVEVLADYLNRHYQDYSLSEEEIFSYAFADTAQRIMTVTKSPLIPMMICVTVIVIAVIIFVILKKRREQREREQQRTEEILAMPLEKFGDQYVEDLAKKYEEE